MDWRGPTWGQMADARDEAQAHIDAHAESAQKWMAHAQRLERQVEAQHERIKALEQGRDLREKAARIAELEERIEALRKTSNVTAREALWSLFMQARSEQVGLQRVISGLTGALSELDPEHKLLDEWWRDTIRGPAFYEEWDRLKAAGIEQVLQDYERDGGHVDIRATAAKEVRTTQAEPPQAASSSVNDFRF